MEEECKYECERMFNCCSCGGNDCGCRYCWDCNACEVCLGNQWEEVK